MQLNLESRQNYLAQVRLKLSCRHYRRLHHRHFRHQVGGEEGEGDHGVGLVPAGFLVFSYVPFLRITCSPMENWRTSYWLI